jgi:hypothetical protein
LDGQRNRLIRLPLSLFFPPSPRRSPPRIIFFPSPPPSPPLAAPATMHLQVETGSSRSSAGPPLTLSFPPHYLPFSLSSRLGKPHPDLYVPAPLRPAVRTHTPRLNTPARCNARARLFKAPRPRHNAQLAATTFPKSHGKRALPHLG